MGFCKTLKDINGEGNFVAFEVILEVGIETTGPKKFLVHAETYWKCF